MCMDRDTAAVRVLGGGISDRFFRIKYEHGIEDGGARCGDSEGGGKSASKPRGISTGHPHHGGDTTPRRRTASSSDSGTHHRADEETRDSSRGGNEG